MPMHVDIPRLREGRVGGFFWSVYVPCPSASAEGKKFLNATWRVRDTLEQIDVAKGLIMRYPEVRNERLILVFCNVILYQTFQFAVSSADVKDSIFQKKIASLLGVEGGHQLGNSIAVLRQYYDLGVRYVTLTHVCHNAFADSCGSLVMIPPLHLGLSPLGFKLIEEMNRIGMLAPVMWSHSSARAVYNVARNVPDEVLSMIGTGEGAEGWYHYARVVADFDGITDTPRNLEDVSKYPNLQLLRRGWDKYDLAGLTGGNFLRVFAAVEDVAHKLQSEGALPVYDVYEEREDMPLKLGRETL
ncbi:hypothetical protein EDD16DRAFT_1545311 [Pisolithus croceorrhizus]|nr:hypothetical protein EDD16DRAFT_1545311 [Pisolithus croceorrhizus]